MIYGRLLQFTCLIVLFSGLYHTALPQNKPDTEPFLSTIVIDPGHGGEDPGTVVQGIREKNIVLDIALRLGKLINEAYSGVNVVYTRTTDTFIPLYERANIANKNRADLFISIHVNYFKRTYIQGTETFVLGLHKTEENLEVAKTENSVILLEEDFSTIYEGFDPNSPESYIMFEMVQGEYLDQSITIASYVQEQFTKYAKRYNRGVKQAGFVVLNRAAMPSILIETGFLSNAEDRSYLTSDKGKNSIAESIMKAIGNYLENRERKSGILLSDRDIPSGNSTGNTRQETAENTDDKSVDPVKNTPAGNSKPDVGKSEPAKPAPVQKKTGNAPANTVKPGATGSEVKPAENKSAVSTVATTPENQGSLTYSVQVSAISRKLETRAENFKGERNLFVKKIGPWYKYFSGRFKSSDEAGNEQKRLSSKFPDAFIVVFDGDKVYPLKN